MEKDFVDFLVVNGITADEWVRLKAHEGKKANRIIDLFSEVVFESTLRKVRFLDHISASRIIAFQAFEKQILMVALEDSSGTIDFTVANPLRQLEGSVPTGVKVYQQSKSYQKQREIELFELCNGGAEISDGSLFKQLSLLYATIGDG